MNLSATELRLGNWFRQSGKDYILDVNAFIDLLDHYYQFKKVLHDPIPLDEEWAKKLGDFTFNEISVRLRDGRDFGQSGEIIVVIEQYSEGECHLEHIKFVHEYQNLFHSLTGEELIIKQ